MQSQTHALLPIIGHFVGMCMLTLPRTMLMPSCGIVFWRASKSSNKHEAMTQIKEEKIKAYNYLEKELLEYIWFMHAYERICKVKRTNNNTFECFNN